MRRPHEPEETPSEHDRLLGRRLQYFREQAGMTRAALADLVDTTEAEIEAWETGRDVIYADEMVDLCHALMVTPNELTGFRPQ